MKTYSLLWSERAKAFHLEELHQTVAHGQRSFSEARDPDFILVGVAESLEGVREIKDDLIAMRPDHTAAEQDVTPNA